MRRSCLYMQYNSTSRIGTEYHYRLVNLNGTLEAVSTCTSLLAHLVGAT